MAEKIRYEVDVDSSDAKRGLQDFSRAAKAAGKDASSALDDTATAGEKARAAIKAMADTMDTELRASAKAADALGQALGPELASRVDLDKIVSDFKRMGVSVTEITADADKFAATLRQVDGIRLQQVNDGLGVTSGQLRTAKGDADALGDTLRGVDGVHLDQVNDGLGETSGHMRTAHDETEGLTDSARGAHSALANMIGNSAQDLGAMGGVAQSAGVAIGQMAEYAADATLAGEQMGTALRSMAGVVGPIAALTAGVQIVSRVMGGFKERAQLAEDHMKRLNDLAAEGGDIIGNYAAALADVGTESFDAQQGLLGFTQMFFGMNTGIVDVTDSLDAAGVTFRDFSRGVTGTAADAQRLQAAFDAAADGGRITQAQWEALTSALSQSRVEWGTTADGVTKANRLMATSTQDVNDAIAALAVAANPLAALQTSTIEMAGVSIDASVEWRRLVKDLQDGHADFAETGQLVSQFSTVMGLSTGDVIALAQAQGKLVKSTANLNSTLKAGVFRDYAKNLDGVAEAQAAAADETDRMTFTQQELADAVKALEDPLKTMPDQWRALIHDFQDGQFDLEGALGSINAIAAATHRDPGDILKIIAEQAAAANENSGPTATALEKEADAAFNLADALQQAADNANSLVDARRSLAESQQSWDDALAALPDQMAASTAALDDATVGTQDWVDARNDARDTAESDIDLLVQTRELQAQQNGETLTATQRTNTYAEGLAKIAGTVDDRVIPALADYYSGILKIPKDRQTEFEMLLIEGDQQKIEDFIAENTGVKQTNVLVHTDAANIAGARRAVESTGEDQHATAYVKADTSSADATLASWRKSQADNPVHVSVVASTSRVNVTGVGGKAGGRSVEESATGQLVATAAPTVHTPSPVTIPAPAPAFSFTINTGVLGNHFDVERTVTRAMRRASRINGRRAVTP